MACTLARLTCSAALASALARKLAVAAAAERGTAGRQVDAGELPVCAANSARGVSCCGHTKPHCCRRTLPLQ